MDVWDCSQRQGQHNSIVFSDVYFLGILSLRNPYFLIGVLLIWRSQRISTSISAYRLPLLVSVFSYPPSSTSSKPSILLSAINKIHSPHSFVSCRFCLESLPQESKTIPVVTRSSLISLLHCTWQPYPDISVALPHHNLCSVRTFLFVCIMENKPCT